MNRVWQKGSSSLLMVFMLFALGILMLNGLAHQLTSQRQQVLREVSFIKRYVEAQSALAWGQQQSWKLQPGWQCQTQQLQGWRACVYQTKKGELLLAATGTAKDEPPPVTLWRWGYLQGNRAIAVAHGWLDFCPLMDDELCNLPL